MPAVVIPSQNMLTMNNRSYGGVSNLTANVVAEFAVALAAAIAWTLTTRTSNTAGVLTVPSGHGITTSDKIDIYWVDSGGVLRKLIGCTVSGTTGTTVTFTGGTGDNLPLASTTGTVQARVALTSPAFLGFAGDNLVALAVDTGPNGGTVVVVDSGAGETVLTTTGTQMVYTWAGVGTNPLAGKTVTGVKVSQAGTTPVTVRGAYGVA